MTGDDQAPAGPGLVWGRNREEPDVSSDSAEVGDLWRDLRDAAGAKPGQQLNLRLDQRRAFNLPG